MKKASEKDSPRSEAGQTLLEILLAFSVAILVLSAVILGITTSLSNTQYTKNQGLANSYAQEGMAVVRKIRDSGWNNFKNLADNYTTNTRYCLGLNSVELGDPTSALNCGQNVGIFSREVKFDHNKSRNGCCSDTSPSCSTGTAGSKTTVKVSWADSKCPSGTNTSFCHSVELITCFSSIDLKPTP